MLSQYFVIADQFLDKCEKITAMTSAQQTYYINYVSEQAEDIYIMIFVSYFDYTFDRYFYSNIDFILTGTINRLGGYIFGWVLVGLGMVFTGFAVYSLVTYSSEDEIKRYELQTKKKVKTRRIREIKETNENTEK